MLKAVCEEFPKDSGFFVSWLVSEEIAEDENLSIDDKMRSQLMFEGMAYEKEESLHTLKERLQKAIEAVDGALESTKTKTSRRSSKL